MIDFINIVKLGLMLGGIIVIGGFVIALGGIILHKLSFKVKEKLSFNRENK